LHPTRLSIVLVARLIDNLVGCKELDFGEASELVDVLLLIGLESLALLEPRHLLDHLADLLQLLDDAEFGFSYLLEVSVQVLKLLLVRVNLLLLFVHDDDGFVFNRLELVERFRL